MIEAMSSGGRIGNDAPYMPRGCDMRWFSTEEICEIFGRFEKVIILGDSMMRHVIGSINVLIRKDLGYGAVTDWNFSPEERYGPPACWREKRKWITMLTTRLQERLLLQLPIRPESLLHPRNLQNRRRSQE